MRFWDSVIIKSPDECWEWRSKAGTGKRAYTSHNGKAWSASRLSWYLTNGEIPEGMCVCHKCDNPPCVNPSHLFLGTHQENVDDRERKGRNKLPGSKGEEHGLHKLTRDEVYAIRNLYSSSPHTYRSLARMFGVSFGEIRKIVKRQTWAWLD